MKDKVVMVSDHHVDSGIGYYGFELAKEMRKLCDTVLVKPFRDNHLDSYLHDEYDWIKKARYKSLKNLRPYILPYFLRLAMVGTKGSLYHAHWFLSGLATTYLVDKPSIITMHDVSLLHISDSTDKYLQYYKWAIERFKKLGIPIIVVSEQSRQDTIKYAEYPEDLVFAIHNGINFDHFFPMDTPKENDKFTMVYSGGLAKRKNVDLLLQAFQILQEKYDFLQLKIAGTHPQNTPYPAMAQSMKLKNVIFTGFVPEDEMNAFYNSGDLMVYTSGYEGFGMAPLEGMACGLPVISTKGGSLMEISGGGAHMVDYEVEEIVSAIEKVIDNSTYRKQLAAKGHNWVKQYTWAKAASKTFELYKLALNETVGKMKTS